MESLLVQMRTPVCEGGVFEGKAPWVQIPALYHFQAVQPYMNKGDINYTFYFIFSQFLNNFIKSDNVFEF